MAHIHFSRGKSYELAINGDENPTEYLESEGERLIKEMVQKQLNKKVSLKEQLQEGKVFETCAEFVPLTKLTSGQVSFSNFKELAEKVSHIEDLKSMGLSEKEIDFLNDYEKGESYFEEKYKKVELSALKTNLEEIQRKIEKRSKDVPDEKSGGKDGGVSRHELELSLCVKPQSEHTKLLQFALSCQQSSSAAVDTRPLNHPINSLKELESELFGHLKPPLPKRKKKRLRDDLEGVGQVSIVDSEEASPSPSSSLWDKRSAPQRVKRQVERADGKSRVYECATKRVFTIRDGEIVALDGRTREMGKGCDSPSDSSTEGRPFVFADDRGESSTSSLQLVPLEKIRSNKMTEEEMSEHPHFNKNYTRGEPSKVLYIKNISPAVKEEDLVCLFGHFETPGENKIAYRLMTGRMKGQAFITFPTIEKASQALEAINGYYCKGKPLALQFGKSKK